MQDEQVMIEDLLSRNQKFEIMLNNLNTDMLNREKALYQTDHDESLKVPKSDQNIFLQAAQAPMLFDGGGADNATL